MTEAARRESRKECHQKLWLSVRENPEDFTSWTQLLKLIQDEEDITVIRNVFEAFLDHYPLCFAYWNKWADLELNKAGFSQCEKVFEIAVRRFPLSVDIWLHYLTTLIHFVNDNKKIEEILEKAVSCSGKEYRSESLWKYYLGWLDGQRDWQKMLTAYDRILQTPIKGLGQFYRAFEKFVSRHSLRDMLSSEELLALSTRLDAQCRNNSIAAGDAPQDCVSKRHLNISGHKEHQMKLELVKQRREIYEETSREVEKREEFEKNVKRSYFHVNPLDYVQLCNWNSYLDWAIESLPYEDVVLLFERCLVVCAFYEQFWLKYVAYLVTQGMHSEVTRAVFRRCCRIHLKKSVTLHCAWALFEEQEGNFSEAMEIITDLEARLPSAIQLICFKVNLIRRSGQANKVKDLYQQLLEEYSSQPNVYSHICLRYATFLRKQLKQEEEAVAALKDALAKNPDSVSAYLQLIDIEMNKVPVDVQTVLNLFDESIKSITDPNHQHLMIQRKYEFAQTFCHDVSEIYQALHDLCSCNYFTGYYVEPAGGGCPSESKS